MSLFGLGVGGTQVVTADAQIGPTGNNIAIRVFSADFVFADTTGNLVLKVGVGATGEVRVGEGTELLYKSYDFGETGIVFPSGCFYDHDSGNSSGAINFVVERC